MISGTCLCNKCTVEIAGSVPASLILCHCTDCQQTSGSSHSVNVLATQSDVKMTGCAQYKMPTSSVGKFAIPPSPFSLSEREADLPPRSAPLLRYVRLCDGSLVRRLWREDRGPGRCAVQGLEGRTYRCGALRSLSLCRPGRCERSCAGESRTSGGDRSTGSRADLLSARHRTKPPEESETTAAD